MSNPTNLPKQRPNYHPSYLNVPSVSTEVVTKLAEYGRGTLWSLIVSNIEGANEIISDLKDSTDPRGNKWQRDFKGSPATPQTEWTDRNTSPFVGNDFEMLSRILESLPVGISDQQAWERAGKLHLQKPRKVNPRVFPLGPNIRVETVQDKDYESDTKDVFRSFQATHAYQTTYFNPVDGVIIATGDSVEWRRLHRPKGGNNLVTNELRAETCAGLGLSASRIAGQYSFLNYIIVMGPLPRETVEVIMACLSSRRVPHGIIPKRDDAPRSMHQTFQAGHWAFYALLATQSSERVAWLLAQHKESLENKILKSVTICAPDLPASAELTEEQQRRVWKWPVMIWELAEYDRRILEEADKTWNQNLVLNEIPFTPLTK